MKKILTLIVSISCALVLNIGHSDAQSAFPGNPSPQFANDITVEVNTLANQRHVRIATAYNGWVFAAYLVNDSVSQKGGVVIRYSRNGGINWIPFNGYPYYDHSQYTACELTVQGTDSLNLSVFMGDVRKDLISNKYEIEVRRYEAAHTAYPPSVEYFKQLDSNKVYDMALASGAPYSSSPDSLYSVGLLYNHHGASMDSLIFVYSKNSLNVGKQFGKEDIIATAPHFRKVSLAYSVCPSIIKGTYNGAWESDSANSTLGHILVSRTGVSYDSAWIQPIYLDSLNPAMIDMVRNPSIAAQNTTVESDSLNVTAAVTFDVARNGFTDSLDVYGFYNNTADSSRFWTLFPVAATTHNELEANINYDPIGNQFLITYYDSTTGGLVYANDSSNLHHSWNVVTQQYNDLTNDLTAPWPRVAINPLTKKAFMAWVEESSTEMGIVKVDGAYLFTSNGPQYELAGLKVYNPYPNPATSLVLLPVSADLAASLKIDLLDVLGQTITSSLQEVAGGSVQYINLDVAGLSAGVYFCRVQSGTVAHTMRLVVQH